MDTAESLIRLVLNHCQQRQWFGTDFLRNDLPDGYVPFAGDTPYFVQRTNFWYPPATPEDIEETERILGFMLPLTLRAMYQTLANGGFGPDGGFLGVHNGATSDDQGWVIQPDGTWRQLNEFGFRIGDLYQHRSAECQFIELDDLALLNNAIKLLPSHVRIKRLLIFGLAIVGTSYAIHADTERIYVLRAVANEWYSVQYLAPSLGEWLLPWLQQKWQPIWKQQTNLLTINDDYLRAIAQQVPALPARQQTFTFHGSYAAFLDRIVTRLKQDDAILFPPTNQAVIKQAEKILRHPLPALLRALYTQIGNGGFGPGQGLFGVGNGHFDNVVTENILSLHLNPRFPTSFRILTQQDRKLLVKRAMILANGIGYPFVESFEKFIPIARYDDYTKYFLNLRTGEIFEASEGNMSTSIMGMRAPSLEGLFEAWLASQHY